MTFHGDPSNDQDVRIFSRQHIAAIEQGEHADSKEFSEIVNSLPKEVAEGFIASYTSEFDLWTGGSQKIDHAVMEKKFAAMEAKANELTEISRRRSKAIVVAAITIGTIAIALKIVTNA